MRGHRFLGAALLVWLVAEAAVAAESYVFDAAHTYIGFSVRHMVITNVQGRFKEFTGTILYDPEDITKSSVQVTIKAASLDTENENRDNHLRSADFFDVANHPDMVFESKRIERQGEQLLCFGTLTIRGTTKEVAIPFTLLGPVKDPRGNLRIGIEAGLSVNRHDYGVSWSRTIEGGGLVVGNDAKLILNVEAVKRPPQPQP